MTADKEKLTVIILTLAVVLSLITADFPMPVAACANFVATQALLAAD